MESDGCADLRELILEEGDDGSLLLERWPGDFTNAYPQKGESFVGVSADCTRGYFDTSEVDGPARVIVRDPLTGKALDRFGVPEGVRGVGLSREGTLLFGFTFVDPQRMHVLDAQTGRALGDARVPGVLLGWFESTDGESVIVITGVDPGGSETSAQPGTFRVSLEDYSVERLSPVATAVNNVTRTRDGARLLIIGYSAQGESYRIFSATDSGDVAPETGTLTLDSDLSLTDGVFSADGRRIHLLLAGTSGATPWLSLSTRSASEGATAAEVDDLELGRWNSGTLELSPLRAGRVLVVANSFSDTASAPALLSIEPDAGIVEHQITLGELFDETSRHFSGGTISLLGDGSVALVTAWPREQGESNRYLALTRPTAEPVTPVLLGSTGDTVDLEVAGDVPEPRWQRLIGGDWIDVPEADVSRLEVRLDGEEGVSRYRLVGSHPLFGAITGRTVSVVDVAALDGAVGVSSLATALADTTLVLSTGS